MRLLRTHTLTLTRYLDKGQQYDPATGKYSTDVVGTTLDITCSVQPFRQGNSQVKLPEGVTPQDTIVVYTAPSNVIQTSSQFTKVPADTTVYKGLVYEAFHAEDWSGYGLKTDNYKAIFIRRDLAGN